MKHPGRPWAPGPSNTVKEQSFVHRSITRLAGPQGSDDGSNTIEYALGALAAAAFAAVLIKVVNGPAVAQQLGKLITEALQ